MVSAQLMTMPLCLSFIHSFKNIFERLLCAQHCRLNKTVGNWKNLPYGAQTQVRETDNNKTAG